MAHIERTTLIEAPIADVFEYATIIPKLTEWWPSLMDVRKYTQERMATGVRYEWTYKMVGVKLDGTAEILECAKNEHVRWENGGAIPGMFDWRYAREAGMTRVTVSLDYTVPGSVLGKLADKLFVERLNEREAESVLAHLKSICEAAAKPSAAARA